MRPDWAASMRPGWWVATYRCALHSGIPRCCARFFVQVRLNPERWHAFARALHYRPDHVEEVETQRGTCLVVRHGDAYRVWNPWFELRDRAAADAGVTTHPGFVQCPDCYEDTALGVEPPKLVRCEFDPAPSSRCRVK